MSEADSKSFSRREKVAAYSPTDEGCHRCGWSAVAETDPLYF